MTEELSPSRWGSPEAFRVDELKDLISCLTERPTTFISGEHPIANRLAITLTLDSTETMLLSLDLLSRLSLNPAEAEVVRSILEQSANQVESFLNSRRPGTEVQLHSGSGMLLQAVFLTSLSQPFKGIHALELFDGAPERVIRACSSILRTLMNASPTEYQSDLVESKVKTLSTTCRILYDLVSYRSYWSATCQKKQHIIISGKKKGGVRRSAGKQQDEEGQVSQEDLAKGFDQYMSRVNEAALDVELFDIVGMTMSRWYTDIVAEPRDAQALRLLPQFEIILSDVLLFVCNCLSYTSGHTAQLKKHLSMRTVLLQNVVLPFLLFLIDAARSETPLPGDTGKSILILLRVISLVMFNIRAFRPWIARYPDIIIHLCECGRVFSNDNEVVEMYAHMTRLVVNAELVDTVGPLLERTASNLSEQQRVLLSLMLQNPRERLQPMSIFCETYGKLQSLFSLKDVSTTVAASLVSNRTLHRRSRNRRRRQRNKGRYQALHHQRQGDTTTIERASTASDVVPFLVDNACTAAMNAVGAPPALVQCDHTHVDENKDDDSETSLCMDSSTTTSSSTDGVLPEDEAAPHTTSAKAAPAQSSSTPAQLVDELSNWRTRTPPGVPSRYLCALTHQVMMIPVLSPYGDTFDRESIARYLQTHRTCPITGEALFMTDLVVDPTLKRELDVVRYQYV